MNELTDPVRNRTDGGAPGTVPAGAPRPPTSGPGPIAHTRNGPASALATSKRPKRRRALHDQALAGGVYQTVLQHGLANADGSALERELLDGAVRHTAEVAGAVGGSDPLRRMLAEQMLWTHARLARLTQLAATAKDPDRALALHEACDRTANAFRRQLIAARDCSQQSSPSVNQTFVADQQVIGNMFGPTGQEKGTNELGDDSGHARADSGDRRRWSKTAEEGGCTTDHSGNRTSRLTAEGRRALSEAARRNQPWRASTGPRTAAGKARSSRNALKHGERSATVRAARSNARKTIALAQSADERSALDA
jgi:hypothetical protein